MEVLQLGGAVEVRIVVVADVTVISDVVTAEVVVTSSEV
jgi:hypothetical protein